MKKFKLLVDNYEIKIIINALNELRTKQLNESRPTDAIDELLLKMIKTLEKNWFSVLFFTPEMEYIAILFI